MAKDPLRDALHAAMRVKQRESEARTAGLTEEVTRQLRARGVQVRATNYRMGSGPMFRVGGKLMSRSKLVAAHRAGKL